MKRLLLFFCAASLLASTTTITQTVTGSDGSNSNGTVLVRISAPCQSGANYVDQRTIAVSFLNGALSLSLAPNDSCVTTGTETGTTYAVSFMTCPAVSGATTAKPCPTGASQQWSQTWAVPTSSTPVTVNSIVVPTPTGSVPLLSGALTGDVVKSSGSSATTVEAIQGHPVTNAAPTDGQTYRYSASSGQWNLVTFVQQEILTGTLDGTNVTFTLTHAPAGGLTVKRNGLEQFNGSAGDYTVSGNTVTFATVSTPQPGDLLTANYIY